MCAGVKDEVINAELIAALEFFLEGAEAPGEGGSIDGGEVDEVAGVDDEGGEGGLMSGFFEEVDLLGGEGFYLPLALVGAEELNTLAVGGFGDEQGVVRATGGGHVGTESEFVGLAHGGTIETVGGCDK